MPDFVQGTCEEMCPKQEIQLRTKERLLHFFEQKPGEKHVPWKMVKAFSRSAAGVRAPRKADLRTPRALQNTVEYLLKEIILDKRRSLPFIYDFIFDRLRCVRQEIVMQNYNCRNTLNLLEPIIMFLAFSRYRLCTEPIDNFDPKICDQHLQECLKKALCCYDELDQIEDRKETLNIIKNRSFIESLYLIFNLGSFEALQRSLHLPASVRNPIFCLTQKIALEFYRNNYYKVINGMHELPHLLAAIASLKLQYIRRELYQIFSHAYNSKQLTVPIEWLQQLLLYSDRDSICNDCKYYGIEVQSSGGAVIFSKANFNGDITIRNNEHENFVEQKLSKIFLPEILLLKRL